MDKGSYVMTENKSAEKEVKKVDADKKQSTDSKIKPNNSSDKNISDKKYSDNKNSESKKSSKPSVEPKEFVIEDVKPIVYKNKDVLKYKKKKTMKLVAFLVAMILIVFGGVAVYFVGVFKYKNVFAPNTKINEVDVSGMTVDEAKDAIYKSDSSYNLTMNFKNGVETLKVGDGGLDIIYENDLQEFLDSQDSFQWILNIGAAYDYEAKYKLSYTEEGIKGYLSTLSELDSANMTPSKNAVITMKDGKVSVEADEEGTELDKEKVYNLVLNAIADGSTVIDIKEHGCYVGAQMSMNSKVIKRAEENAERYLSIKASYYDEGETILTISSEDLCSMGYLNEDGEIEIDKNKVVEYVNSISANFEDKYGGSKVVSFKNHEGKEKEVKAKGSYLYFDADTEAEELYENLCSMKDFERVPAYTTDDVTSGYNVKVDDTYLEIDLGEQHVYLYKNGKAVFDTPCVSGCVAWNTKTPAGLYKMGPLERNARLVGENKAYDTRVAYWMPFIGQGIGLHDAPWKYQFGGDIYKTDGSHGCINLSSEAAETLYGLVYQGIPVVVYY